MYRSVCLGLGLVVLCIAGAVPAAANHVGCGDVITASTTLDSDLVNCPADGVVIGADGITLDLARHTIDGSGPGNGSDGVDNTAGHDDVNVVDGTVQQFDRGVQHVDAAGGAVRNLHVGDAGIAVFLQRSDDFFIDRNSVRAGIALLDDVDGNVISRNDIRTPGTGIFILGIVPAGSQDNQVLDNEVSGVSTGVAISDSVDTVVSRNRIGQTVENGMQIAGSTSGARVEDNIVSENGLGILVG